MPPTARVIRATRSEINLQRNIVQARKPATDYIDAEVPIVDKDKNGKTTIADEEMIEIPSEQDINKAVNIKDESALEKLRQNIPQLNLKPLTVAAKENDLLAFKVSKIFVYNGMC